MSTPSLSPDPLSDGRSSDAVGSVRERLIESLRRLSFWSAIVLPVLYLPVLVTGLGTPDRLIVFFVLLTFNVLALLFGHSYDPD